MDLPGIAERVWYGDDPTARAARTLLAPLELVFRGVVAGRERLYDRGLLPSRALALPAISVGNLTVGGTGKTPVSAWLVGRLLEHGAHPALVLRGVGDDEARVHALLNPRAPVVATPDRVAGAAEARERGADVVVLDDAFQHRRARRDVDLVLVSAERAAGVARLLPAGPYREAPRALARASALLVTRRTASADAAGEVLDALAEHAPDVPGAVAHLAADALRRWPGEPRDPGDPVEAGAAELSVAALHEQLVLAVSGIGEPAAFEAQLAAAGARVEGVRFPDHHRYDERDVRRLVGRAVGAAGNAGAGLVVTTLKDAVKLGPRWPRGAPPLWYVSQRVSVERGAVLIDGLLRRLLDARRH